MVGKLTIDDGQKALAEHAREKGFEIRTKYGSNIDYATLLRVLGDSKLVRFPVEIEFDSHGIEPGMFAMTRQRGERPGDGYVIQIHSHFEDRLDDIPPLVLYHLVAVNYGDFATAHDAEVFGAAALGMDQEAYYESLCRLADGMTGASKANVEGA